MQGSVSYAIASLRKLKTRLGIVGADAQAKVRATSLRVGRSVEGRQRITEARASQGSEFQSTSSIVWRGQSSQSGSRRGTDAASRLACLAGLRKPEQDQLRQRTWVLATLLVRRLGRTVCCHTVGNAKTMQIHTTNAWTQHACS